ncbi:MAG: RNA polymerase sigma factor [Prevotella sp.]|nr:RNA polymerase sigma factor [Prevotella sp.]
MKNISFRDDVLPLKDKLYRLALRITLNNAEAEDVVQETLIKVWNRRSQWEEIESIEAFALTVCRNLSLDKIKRMGNDHDSLDDSAHDSPDSSSSSNPEEQTMARDQVALVRQLIDRLPEKQRSVIQLRDIEGKSYREIANIMCISEEQVKVNLYRARQTIKKKFSETDSYGL